MNNNSIIVQVGANRGYDMVTDMTHGNIPSLLILVEPFNEHNDGLAECYKHVPNCNIENIAIVGNSAIDTASLHYHIADSEHQDKFLLASLNKELTKKILGYSNRYTEEGMRQRVVPAMTLNALFDKYNLKDIDVLFIDAEGHDDEIIKDIDFEKYNIDEIYYEHLHINAPLLRIFLESKGYAIEQGVGLDHYSDRAFKENPVK